jgi:hypothetical protein
MMVTDTIVPIVTAAICDDYNNMLANVGIHHEGPNELFDLGLRSACRPLSRLIRISWGAWRRRHLLASIQPEKGDMAPKLLENRPPCRSLMGWDTQHGWQCSIISFEYCSSRLVTLHRRTRWLLHDRRVTGVSARNQRATGYSWVVENRRFV